MFLFLLLFAAESVQPANAGWPTFQDWKSSRISSEWQLRDRNGVVLQELRVGHSERRSSWIPLSEVSEPLKQAVLYSEDREFYSHRGVDWRALAGAAVQNLFGESRRGASTITMQLVGLMEKRIAGRRGRSLSQKWDQIQQARSLEQSWKKDEILEAYLNEVPFRGETVGVGAATWSGLGKAPWAVTWPEAIALAVTLRSPQAGPSAIERRAQALWSALLPQGVDWSSVVRALVPVTSRRYGSWKQVNDAPHAARRVFEVHSNTLNRSSLDSQVQAQVGRLLEGQLETLRGKGVANAAAVVFDRKKARVLAYQSLMSVDGVQARRQAGSTLKPFIYALAFERRILTPESWVEDSSTDFELSGGVGVYRPRDHDQKFQGTVVPARVALASSLNVPAVRTLLAVGVEALIDRLRALGFEGLGASDHYGPSLALGTADVSLWELAVAALGLSRGGVAVTPSWNPNEDGKVGKRVFSSNAASQVIDALSDPSARALSFGLDTPLNNSVPAWAKTGTSKDLRDLWCVGGSDHFIVAVWMGNANGEPMRQVSGMVGAAPAWSRIIEYLEASAAQKKDQRRRVPLVQPVSLPELPIRIRYPTSGTRIAWDPDIPAQNQKIFFEIQNEAQALKAGWELRLDGQAWVWGEGFSPREKGKHTLVLTHPVQGDLDRTDFFVR